MESVLPALKDRILSLLQNGAGLTDREITDRLFAPGSPQQPVNQVCRQLESCSVIEAERQEKAEIEAQRQKAELAADREAAGNK